MGTGGAVPGAAAASRLGGRRLFVVDLCGAGLSAAISGLVLPRYAPWLGVANSALERLAAIAIVIALFDAACLVFRPRPWRAMLRVVALTNLAYPLVAAAVVATDGVALAPWGAALLGVEALVLVALGAVQLHTARRR